MNDQNQPNDELLPNQRYCPNPLKLEKCSIIVTHISKLQCDAAIRYNRLCSNCARLMKNKHHNIEILLNESHESFYWIGFLLADGTFTKSGELRCHLAIKDLPHLEKLVKYVEYKNKIHLDHNDNPTNCLISIRDEIIVKQIINKFDIHHKKTYNPPHNDIFTNMKLDQLKSLILGFIDGDGSISPPKSVMSKYVHLTIGCHKSWGDTFKHISEILSNNWYSYCYKEVSYLKNMTFLDIKNLKLFALENNLPIMDRKWDNVDIHHNTTREISAIRRKTINSMFENGMTINEISDELRMWPCEIINDLNKFKIKNDTVK